MTSVWSRPKEADTQIAVGCQAGAPLIVENVKLTAKGSAWIECVEGVEDANLYCGPGNGDVRKLNL